MARRIGFPLRRLWRVRIPHAGRVTGAVALALLAALLIHSAMRMDAAGTPVEPSLAVSYHVGPLETSSADGVWRSPAQAEWRAAEGDELHLGFRGEPVWLRVEVANDAARPFDGMLVYKFPYIDRILFHGYDDTGAPAIRLRGDRAPLDRSLPASHFPAFPVEVAAGGTAVFHLEVTTTSVVLAPLKLYSEKGFERMVLGDHLLFGALFGAVLAVCMYVFTVYLTVRDKAYLDFIPFSLAYAGYVAVASGMGQIWFWPGGWEYANPLFFMLQGLLFASGVRFFQRYLGTPERHPKVDMIMRLLVVVGLLTSLAPVLPVPVGAALIAFVAGGDLRLRPRRLSVVPRLRPRPRRRLRLGLQPADRGVPLSQGAGPRALPPDQPLPHRHRLRRRHALLRHRPGPRPAPPAEAAPARRGTE
jgi:hypothetical protein